MSYINGYCPPFLALTNRVFVQELTGEFSAVIPSSEEPPVEAALIEEVDERGADIDFNECLNAMRESIDTGDANEEKRSEDAVDTKCVDERDDGADANDGERLSHPDEESIIIAEAVKPNENNNSSSVFDGVFDVIRQKIDDEFGDKEGESKQICIVCNEEIVPIALEGDTCAASVIEVEKEMEGDTCAADLVDVEVEKEISISGSAEEKCDALVEEVAEPEEEWQKDVEAADGAESNVNASADNRCEPEPERKVTKPEVAKPEVVKPEVVEPEEKEEEEEVDDDEEEEEDLVDPRDPLKEKCYKGPECRSLKKTYDVCNNRLEQG